MLTRGSRHDIMKSLRQSRSKRMPKKPSEIIWVRRNGFGEENEHIYEVIRAQNIVAPRIGSYVDEKEIEALVGGGVTVNIS